MGIIISNLYKRIKEIGMKRGLRIRKKKRKENGMVILVVIAK